MLQGGVGTSLGDELSPGGRVVDTMGTEDLDRDQAQEMVVPGEVSLVIPTSAKQFERVASGGDLLALVERPGPCSPSVCRQGGLVHSSPPFARTFEDDERCA